MHKDTWKLTALAAALAAIPAVTLAQLSLGDQVGTSQAEITAWLQAQGAEMRGIEIEDDEIEVEYVLDGVEYEAEIDPATGQVIALEVDADDHGDEEGGDEEDGDEDEDDDKS